MRQESIYDNVEVTKIPCTMCSETGISEYGLNESIEDIKVSKWLLGELKDLKYKDNISEELLKIHPMKKISSLNKEELLKVFEFINK